jgi:methoxymalonate biosynthesis acyl carrier protein
MDRIITTLSGYLRERYSAELAPEDNLFASGIIDSLGFANLIMFVTEEFGVAIDPDDLVEENFQSLQRIAEFLVEKVQ